MFSPASFLVVITAFTHPCKLSLKVAKQNFKVLEMSSKCEFILNVACAHMFTLVIVIFGTGKI